MDPCPFVRLVVESLSLKLPPPSTTTTTKIIVSHFCTIHLYPSSLSPPKTTPLPLFLSSVPSKILLHIDPSSLKKSSPVSLVVSVTALVGKKRSSRLLGRVRFPVNLNWKEPVTYRTGWVSVGKGLAAELHLTVRSELEPRFVFQFGGEPECNPVVYQVHDESGGRRGMVRQQQPVFSCRFSADRRSTGSNRSLPSADSDCRIRNSSGCCYFSLGTRRKHMRLTREQRKGWTVTIHDLSGSPVAAASMITPFVPSPGSNRVSRSNPGAWLILQPTSVFPAANAWSPWGRLEAWREKSPGADALGYRFELVVDSSASSITIAESKLSVWKGGEFHIDTSSVSKGEENLVFVMESTVGGEGKVSRPTVQVGVQHVRCMADAALFVALSAAVDLSMDACRLFSKKLRKELCYDRRKYSS